MLLLIFFFSNFLDSGSPVAAMWVSSSLLKSLHARHFSSAL